MPGVFEKAQNGADFRAAKYSSPQMRPAEPVASTCDVRSLLYDSEDSEEITSLVAPPTLDQLIELEEEHDECDSLKFEGGSDFASIFGKEITLYKTQSMELAARNGR